jgi:16S rRNA (cytosine967-C5)-methyltransferase
MSRWHAYLNTSKKIIEQYDGRSPLAGWLKDYFRQHKQMGSSDRKNVSELVYGYFRLGHSASGLPVEEKLLTGLFLNSSSPREMLQQIKPGWNDQITLPLQEKISSWSPAEETWFPEAIFPWQQELSEGVDHTLFNRSFLIQPDLFLRIRPGNEDTVPEKLQKAGLPYVQITESCLSLANASKLDDILQIDKEAVVQDLSSQKTGAFFAVGKQASISGKPAILDCCAASGGKSIMAVDRFPGAQLTVSDIRENILKNLHARFHKAGIAGYEAFLADLSVPGSRLPKQQYDLVITDVPCTGSGTWSRTPEQLYFFDPQMIAHYSDLQKRIVSNAIPQVKDGGRLVYITCSVFKKENEQVVQYIQQTSNLKLLKKELLAGYAMKADSMFVALFGRE